jgi:hypothetical protein
VLASKDKWVKLEGSFSLSNMPKHVVFYLEGPPAGVDLIIDSVTITCSRHKESKVSSYMFNVFFYHVSQFESVSCYAFMYFSRSLIEDN